MEPSKIVAFKLGKEEYGLDIFHVQSIERINHTTRVPNASVFVKGVINLRGNVTPIIELSHMLGMGHTQYTDNSRVIIINYGDSQLGLIVDETSDVLNVNPESIDQAANSGFDSEYFQGIAKIDGRLIILLNLEELLKELVPNK
ncbi:chemotaxis protein CheW [Bacillus sp. DNRA2]|uniref:chemotaxis protein CheW n=1 Tax=Bacillus sp. DNRA2 TaxID=2723053 RepID=UPI001B7CF545|nr:chemotaxis protein CheW [Bacillus sp. DNRA2]